MPLIFWGLRNKRKYNECDTSKQSGQRNEEIEESIETSKIFRCLDNRSDKRSNRTENKCDSCDQHNDFCHDNKSFRFLICFESLSDP